MRYTLANGVERHLSSKFTDNYKFIVPLIVLLVGALIIGLHDSTSKRPHQPLTLGIYTIKSNSGSDNNHSGGHTGSNQASHTTPGSASPMSASGIVASSVAPVSSLQGGLGGGGGSLQTTGSVLPPTGGMGGGGVTSGSSTGGSSTGGGGTGGGTVTPPPSTFPCVDLAGASFTCTYQTCVPPLGLTNGHKAYVTTTGLCVVIN